MASRREFLKKAAAFSVQGAIPLPLASFAAVASVPAATAATPAIVSAGLSAPFVEAMVDKVIMGFSLQSGLSYFSVGELFDSEEEINTLWPEKAQQHLINLDEEDELKDLPAALALLPDNKKGERLDELCDSIFDELGAKTALLHQILIQPEEILFAVQDQPDFIRSVVECNDRFPEAKAYRFDHSVVMSELANDLMRILNLSADLSRSRLPVNGQAFNGPDYFCHIVARRHDPDCAPVFGVSKESFIASVKDWFETRFLEYYSIRLGLYDLSEDRLDAAQERETLLRQFDVGVYNRHQTSIVRNFGSEEAFQTFLKNRKADPALNCLIETIAGSWYDTAVPVQIQVDQSGDLTAVNLHVRMGVGGLALVQQALATIQAVYKEADIRVIESGTGSGSEADDAVLQISYSDASGQSADFARDFEAAFKQIQKQQLDQVLNPVAGEAPASSNNPSPLRKGPE